MRRSATCLLLLLLAALSGCRQEELVSDNRPICFAGTSIDVETRADGSFLSGGGPLVTGEHFAVYAWNTGASWLGANPGVPLLMRPVDVTFANNDDSGTNNTYPDTGMSSAMDRYWPRSGGAAYDYSFCAYYPYGGAGITAPTFASGVGTFAFEVQPSAEEMVDFCVSDVANDIVYGSTNSDYPGTVALGFHHMLTRVQVKFVKARDVDADFDIKIWDARLEGVLSTGTLSAGYTPRETPGRALPGTTTFAWSGRGNRRGYEITLGGEDPGPYASDEADEYKLSLGYTQAVAASDVFLMIPQTMLSSESGESAQRIEFWWSAGASTEATHSILYLDDCLQSIGSSNKAEIDWGMGQFVTYTIVIRATPIEFGEFSAEPLVTVSIAPWGEDVEGYVPIFD